jgi:hypothetical protein
MERPEILQEATEGEWTTMRGGDYATGRILEDRNFAGSAANIELFTLNG